jgi:hypothetical protein
VFDDLRLTIEAPRGHLVHLIGRPFDGLGWCLHCECGEHLRGPDPDEVVAAWRVHSAGMVEAEGHVEPVEGIHHLRRGEG